MTMQTDVAVEKVGGEKLTDEGRARNIASNVMCMVVPHVDEMIAARRDALRDSMPSFDERTAYVPLSSAIRDLAVATDVLEKIGGYGGAEEACVAAILRLANMIAPDAES